MFFRIAKTGSEADLILPGLMLESFEPSAEEAAYVLSEAREWRLEKLSIEESPHLCYNHLTDYSFREEAEAEALIVCEGRFAGVMFEAIDVSHYAGKLRTSCGPGVILTDGRRFGKTREYRMNSTNGFGSSGESEYRLVRKEI